MFPLLSRFPVCNLDFSTANSSFINYALVDAFADSPFKGNPAAIFILPAWQDANWMQQVASELNSNMTAFLVAKTLEPDRSGDTNGISTDQDYYVRYFTPVLEVEICGHATLASSYLLFGSGLVRGDLIRFHTKSHGALHASKIIKNSKDGFMIELDFPILSVSACDTLPAVLACTFKDVKPISLQVTVGNDLLVELPSGDDVKQLIPHFDEIQKCDFRGLIVTGRAGNEPSGIDFVSRFFAPKCGIDEDPVCGQAHCALSAFWAKKLNKNKLTAYQASNRGGVLLLRVDFESNRVFLQGEATLVSCGVFFLNS